MDGVIGMSETLVEFENLSYTYQDGTHALKGVSARIGAGESVAIVGGNGAGKSTLLLLLCCCHLAGEGVLKIGGTAVDKSTLDTVRHRVGMVFQDSDEQLFMPTVWDDVAFGPINKGHAAAEVDSIVQHALDEVGVSELAEKTPYRLSSGQKRLVAIAAILAMRPEVIVLDEPTSNLDPRARRAFINTLNNLDYTKIVASHDLEMVLETCRRTIVMAKGGIIADGPTRTILDSDRILEEGHLEKPMSLRFASRS